MLNFRNLVFCVATVAVTVACGGGGSADGSPNSPGTANSTSDVNGDLVGRIVSGGHLDGWMISFTTGNYSRIPGMELWNHNPIYPGAQQILATVLPVTGSEMVETVDSCGMRNPLLFYTCMRVRDGQGNLLSDLSIDDEILGAARLSREAQLVSYIHLHYVDEVRTHFLETVDVSGHKINQSTDPIGGNGSFDWLPGERLVYTSGQSIFVTAPRSAQGSVLVTFPAERGFPNSVAVSPDGRQLAFHLVTDLTYVSTKATVWVVNVDGTGLRRIAVIPGNDNPSIVYPAWSPDGRWILVQAGGTGAASANEPGVPGALYAVPADGEDVPLVPDGSSPARVIRTRYGMTYNQNDTELSTRFQSSGYLAWIP